MGLHEVRRMPRSPRGPRFGAPSVSSGSPPRWAILPGSTHRRHSGSSPRSSTLSRDLLSSLEPRESVPCARPARSGRIMKMRLAWSGTRLVWICLAFTIGLALILAAFLLPARPSIICPGGPGSFLACRPGLDHRVGVRIVFGALGLVVCLWGVLASRHSAR